MPADDRKSCKLAAVDDAQKRHAHAGQRIARKPTVWLLVAGAYAIGGGGMLAWLAFLLLGPPVRLDFGFGTTGRLLIDALLCLIFFLQHSGMVRRGFRLWLTRTVHADLHGALYATVSGLCLWALVVFWQPAGSPLWRPPEWIPWTMLTIALASGTGAWWGARSLGEFDALGIKPALRSRGRVGSSTPLTFSIRGPYRWVRHPLYLFSLVIIWCGPVFTPDRMLHNALWTIWIVVGAALEERDLVACFGDAYRSYRRTVPMLLPRGIRPRIAEKRRTIPTHPLPPSEKTPDR